MRQILCFGDSNTWGYTPDTHKRFPWGVRWTSILQEKLKNEDVRIIEEGLCGRTTVFDDALRPHRNGAKVLPLVLETYSEVDTIILMLGTNDCKSYYSASARIIGKGIEILLDQIQKHCPSAHVILVSPIHLGENVWREEFDPEFDQISVQTSKELKEVYQGIAKKRGISFLAASDYVVPSMADQEHISAEGHRTLAEILYWKVQEVKSDSGCIA